MIDGFRSINELESSGTRPGPDLLPNEAFCKVSVMRLLRKEPTSERGYLFF